MSAPTPSLSASKPQQRRKSVYAVFAEDPVCSSNDIIKTHDTTSPLPAITLDKANEMESPKSRAGSLARPSLRKESSWDFSSFRAMRSARSSIVSTLSVDSISSINSIESLSRNIKGLVARSSNPDSDVAQPASPTSPTRPRGYTPRRAKSSFMATATPMAERNNA